MDHVRVGEQPPRAFPGESAYLRRGVTVIGGGRDVGQYGGGKRVGGAQLVVPSALVGTGTTPGRGVAGRASMIGSWNASDLPDAVPC